jgi:hypothetical protein
VPALLASAAFSPAAGPAPTRGRVLILDNEQTLVGDVERDGDQYRVRRPVGETLTPADRVLRLCASLEDAYAFLKGRANLDDPDERLRLAEWCRRNGLREQAVAEVQAAADLRPGDAATRRLLAHLREAAPAPAPSPPPPEEPAPAAAPVDVTADAVGAYVSRVQPILMNACAGCHAGGRGGAFRLTRTYDAAALNRKAVQQNLAAVLAEVNVAQPAASPLLTKAVSVHGLTDKAPLPNRQAAAYRTLEDWVRQTLADNPQLSDRPTPAPPTTATPPAAPGAPSSFAESRPTTPAGAPVVPAEMPEPLKTPEASKVAAPVAPPARVVHDPNDPYSPDAFNRQFHPDRYKATPAPKP